MIIKIQTHKERTRLRTLIDFEKNTVLRINLYSTLIFLTNLANNNFYLKNRITIENFLSNLFRLDLELHQSKRNLL